MITLSRQLHRGSGSIPGSNHHGSSTTSSVIWPCTGKHTVGAASVGTARGSVVLVRWSCATGGAVVAPIKLFVSWLVEEPKGPKGRMVGRAGARTRGRGQQRLRVAAADCIGGWASRRGRARGRADLNCQVGLDRVSALKGCFNAHSSAHGVASMGWLAELAGARLGRRFLRRRLEASAGARV